MFHNCRSSKDVKDLWRRLILLIHKDKGGDDELVILLNESRERALIRIEKSKFLTDIYEIFDFLIENQELLSPNKFEVVLSMQKYLLDNAELTDRQLDYLMNIYQKAYDKKNKDLDD